MEFIIKPIHTFRFNYWWLILECKFMVFPSSQCWALAWMCVVTQNQEWFPPWDLCELGGSLGNSFFSICSFFVLVYIWCSLHFPLKICQKFVSHASDFWSMIKTLNFPLDSIFFARLLEKIQHWYYEISIKNLPRFELLWLHIANLIRNQWNFDYRILKYIR